MNKLPEKWCIENDYQEVRDYLAEKYNILDVKDWEYVYIGYDGCSSHKGVHGCSLGSFEPGTVQITIEEFKKYTSKQEETMTKQDFTIEGSDALKKAFIEECGIPPLTDKSHTVHYLCSTIDRKNLQSSGIRKKDVHFTLPSQWEKALQYVKEYFAEDEFKVGDWVVVTGLEYNNDKAIYHKGLVAQISKNRYHTQKSYSGKDNWWHWLEFNGVLLSPHNAVGQSCLRMATPEEIEKAKIKTKTFKLGDFTAIVSKDKVIIADRGSVTISECIKWFEKEFNVGNDKYSSLGEFAVTENTYTLNLGCVRNVPVKDIEEVYKYLKTL